MACATAPSSDKSAGKSDAQDENLLSRAASQLQAPDAPGFLTLRDEAQVEWKHDKSVKIAVHQIWAARTKPGRPLPALATLNRESQDLTVQTLQLYNLADKGGFRKSGTPEIQWTPPEADLPPSLSKIATARLPELNAGQALEVKYTLETKTVDLLKTPQKVHPVEAEASFAFRWNDHVPSLKRELTVRIPKSLPLYGSRLRVPKNLVVTEEKTAQDTVDHFSLEGPTDPVPEESYQPPVRDLAPLTSFTPYKSWDEAVFPYRKRVKQLLERDLSPLHELVDEAVGNTTAPAMERVAQVKSALHRKIRWVDTGLPVYLNPDRPATEVLESGVGTSHDMAVLLAMALKAMKIPAQIYLYRRNGSGEFLPDLPALSQLDGILVAAKEGKSWIWMDPTEPLAPPGRLPLEALDRQALGVLSPLQWLATPSFTAKDHRKERDVSMEFLPNGDLKCKVRLQAYGSSELALRQFFRMTTEEKRREMVLKGLSKRFPGAVLTDYQYGDYRDTSKPLEVEYTFQVPAYGETNPKGEFLFYPLVFEDVEDFLANLRDSRKTPVVVSQNFNSNSHVLVKLPRGLKVKELPKDASLSNPVAEFISNAKMEFGSIVYERYMGLKQRVIHPGKEYSDLLGFYQAVLNQDRTPFVTVKGR